MAWAMEFNNYHIALTNKVFDQAETLAARYLRLGGGKMRRHRYDVKTLAYLEEHEKNERSFAHLCKYQSVQGSGCPAGEGLYFYRICLQDNRILDAVQRAGSFIKLAPLLLYIATHELIHVARFEEGEIDFHASQGEKEREEERVHRFTRCALQQITSPDLRLVFDCFSDRYIIGGIFN